MRQLVSAIVIGGLLVSACGKLQAEKQAQQAAAQGQGSTS